MNPTNRNYRATFILDTTGVEDVDKILEDVKQEIVTVEGEVGEIENLGQREFARVTNPKRPRIGSRRSDRASSSQPNRLSHLRRERLIAVS
jgi:hypothetical protein